MTLLERHAPFRTVVSAPAYRGLVGVWQVVTVLVMVPLGLGVGLGSRLLRPSVGADLGVVPILLVVVGVSVSLVVRFASTARTAQVTRPQNLPLLHALDVGPWAVHAEVTARPLVRSVAGATLFASTALLVRSADGAADAGHLWIGLLPTVAGVAVLWFTLRQVIRAVGAGTRPPSAVGAGSGRVSVLALAAVGAGWCAGAVAVALQQQELADVPFTAANAALERWGGLILGGLVTAVVMIALACSFASVRLSGRGYERQLAVRRPAGRTSRGRQRPLRADVVAARHFHASALARTATRPWLAVALLAAAATGALAAGVSIDADMVPVLVALTTGYASVTALVVVGAAFTIIGPAATLPRLRWEWENSGRSHLSLAAAWFAYPLRLVTPPAVLLALLQSILMGAPHLGVPATAWALVGSATVAETLLPAQVKADGTVTPGPLTAVVVLLLTAPVLAARSAPFAPVVQTVWAVALLGGGAWCLGRRIRALRSSSAR